jgi:hypothetical protein
MHLALRGDPQRLLAVPRQHDLVPVALERQGDELEDVRVVVGDQDERADGHSVTSGVRSGRPVISDGRAGRARTA